MALATWPASLPTTPLQEGSSLDSLNQAPIETKTEDGPVLRRPRSAAKYGEVTLRFFLTYVQFATYEAFINTTLNMGAASFYMPVWKPGLSTPYPTKVTAIRWDNGGPKIVDNGVGVHLTLPVRARDY